MAQHKLLGSVSDDQHFHLPHGRKLKNLYELVNALTGMDDKTFKHHVSHDKNDFANWVRHVFEDELLADALDVTKTKWAAVKAINKRLADFKSTPTEKKIESVTTKKEKTASKTPAKKKKTTKKTKKKAARKRIVEKETAVDDILKPQATISEKVDEILEKEQEIGRREEKIKEIEEHIEKQLEQLKNRGISHDRFFSRDFVQGLVVGFLITLILLLVYVKFLTI